jgi:hypothetical protein
MASPSPPVPATVQLLGDRKAEHAVAQELQALERLAM